MPKKKKEVKLPDAVGLNLKAQSIFDKLFMFEK